MRHCLPRPVCWMPPWPERPSSSSTRFESEREQLLWSEVLAVLLQNQWTFQVIFIIFCSCSVGSWVVITSSVLVFSKSLVHLEASPSPWGAAGTTLAGETGCRRGDSRSWCAWRVAFWPGLRRLLPFLMFRNSGPGLSSQFRFTPFTSERNSRKASVLHLPTWKDDGDGKYFRDLKIHQDD